jgi:putative nucleotidyltransferase with HDIG domain
VPNGRALAGVRNAGRIADNRAMHPARSLETRHRSSTFRDVLLRRMESGSLELPILPEAATSVLQACRDENVAPRQVAETLERDPALAGHVLRVANSAAYAGSEPIVSLAQAVGRLGLATVSEITLAVALKANVFRAGRHEALVRPVWTHSAAASGWAREIARLGRRNVESAFLCGLLHDIGKPVIVQAAVEVERHAGETLATADIQLASDQLHAVIGASLAERWGLPEWVAAAIRWHHDADAAPGHHEIVRITALADRLAHWMLEEEVGAGDGLQSLELVGALDIYPDEFKELLGRREQVERLTRALGG